MKILYPILSYYPSEFGGKADIVYNINKALSKLNIESSIISTKFGIICSDINRKENYDKYNINVDFINNSLISLLNKKQIIKIKGSDIIHFSSLFFKPTFFYILLSLFWSKKIIISPRGELYPYALNRKNIIKLTYIFFLRIFSKKIRFHATNEDEKELIVKYFPKNKGVTIIQNFIEIPQLLNLKKKKQFLFLGRINPIKNIHLLIEAYLQLPDNIKSSFKLKIVGEAKLKYEKKYKDDIIQLVKDNNLINNIKFLGPKFGLDKEKILSESYCLVLPSKSENFGNVIIESLSQKTPVVVSKYAPWKIVETSNSGYCIDTKIEDIKNKLIDIIDLNVEEYKIFQENALNLVSENFDIKKNINIWEDYYKNV